MPQQMLLLILYSLNASCFLPYILFELLNKLLWAHIKMQQELSRIFLTVYFQLLIFILILYF
jgi:hypothetical protein